MRRTSSTSALIVGRRPGVAASVGECHQSRSSHQSGLPFVEGVVHDVVVDSVWESEGCAAHEWIPHSVLLVPAQRPLRGSSPGATRRVHGQQPIDG